MHEVIGACTTEEYRFKTELTIIKSTCFHSKPIEIRIKQNCHQARFIFSKFVFSIRGHSLPKNPNATLIL